jgi:hypothetical protein
VVFAAGVGGNDAKKCQSQSLDRRKTGVEFTYPVLVINGNTQFAKTAHAPTGDEIENIPIWHPRSPPSVV